MKKLVILITILWGFVQCSPKVIPVFREPRHNVVYQSKNARVLDVRFPPGDTCLFHEHTNNYFYIMLKGGKLATQEPEEDFRAFTLPDAYSGGDFELPMIPNTHRVANLDADTLRFMAVENLRPTTHPIYKYLEHPYQTLIENNKVFRMVKIELPINGQHDLNFNTPTLLVNRLQSSFILNDSQVNKVWDWWEKGGEISIQNLQKDTLELHLISLK